MGRVYNPHEQVDGGGWRQVDRRGAVGVTSHMLLPAERGGRTRLSLTHVEAGGTFGPHIDDYEHVFSVQAGHGEAMVGKLRRPIAPGDIITTDINEPHGLWASPDEDLVLVTANIYQQ